MISQWCTLHRVCGNKVLIARPLSMTIMIKIYSVWSTGIEYFWHSSILGASVSNQNYSNSIVSVSTQRRALDSTLELFQFSIVKIHRCINFYDFTIFQVFLHWTKLTPRSRMIRFAAPAAYGNCSATNAQPPWNLCCLSWCVIDESKHG